MTLAVWRHLTGLGGRTETIGRGHPRKQGRGWEGSVSVGGREGFDGEEEIEDGSLLTPMGRGEILNQKQPDFKG